MKEVHGPWLHEGKVGGQACEEFGFRFYFLSLIFTLKLIPGDY